MSKLTADRCREQLNECRALKERGYLSINGEYKLQALEIALPILEQQESDGDIFIVMRNPGKVPDIKRPVGDVADYLLELYQYNPDAVCDVVTYRFAGVSGQWVQDGRELLAMAGVVLEQQERCEGEWIDWKGGEQPVNGDVLVETKWSDGSVSRGEASDWRWEHHSLLSKLNLIAYRIIPERAINIDERGF